MLIEGIANEFFEEADMTAFWACEIADTLAVSYQFNRLDYAVFFLHLRFITGKWHIWLHCTSLRPLGLDFKSENAVIDCSNVYDHWSRLVGRNLQARMSCW